MLKDEEESKDILQEIFSGVWLHRRLLPSHENFAGYLYITARRKVLNSIRHNKYHDAYLGELVNIPMKHVRIP